MTFPSLSGGVRNREIPVLTALVDVLTERRTDELLTYDELKSRVAGIKSAHGEANHTFFSGYGNINDYEPYESPRLGPELLEQGLDFLDGKQGIEGVRKMQFKVTTRSPHRSGTWLHVVPYENRYGKASGSIDIVTMGNPN